MNTTQKIIKALRISYLIYDNFREIKFIDWCRKYAQKEGLSMHAMITHDGLRNWYQDNWLVFVEQAFAAHYAEELEDSDADTMLTLFELLTVYPDIILETYPQPILNMIKTESNGTVRQKRTEGTRVGA